MLLKKLAHTLLLKKNLFDKCEKQYKSNHNKKKQTLDMCVTKSDTLNAEVIWTSKSVVNELSVWANAKLKMKYTFAAIFPDSKFASSFSMGRINRIKAMYVINHGLAPCFKYLLLDSLKHPRFETSFDKSLNDITEACEMDFIHILLGCY